MDDLFCRLYLASHEGEECVRSALNTEIDRYSQGISIEGILYRNDAFVPGRHEPYDPIESSRSTVELASDAEVGSEAFKSSTVGIVRGLRAHGFVVTASRDFEDKIISETGWNWSTATPVPPS